MFVLLIVYLLKWILGEEVLNWRFIVVKLVILVEKAVLHVPRTLRDKRPLCFGFFGFLYDSLLHIIRCSLIDDFLDRLEFSDARSGGHFGKIITGAVFRHRLCSSRFMRTLQRVCTFLR